MIVLFILLLDGTSVNLKVPEGTMLPFVTPYGRLIVPAKSVSECILGVHPDNPAAHEAALGALGAEKFTERVDAEKLLKGGKRSAYPYLLKGLKHDNLEIRRRCELMIKDYPKPLITTDLLRVNKDSFTGTLDLEVFEGVSESLGELKIKVSNVDLFRVQQGSNKVEIGGIEWVPVWDIIDGKVKITATGQVDMYPVSAGQYVTQPNGFGNGALNGPYPQGALVGRIGSQTFLIGSDFRSTTLPRGQLELRIHPPGWDLNPGGGPSGAFTVTIE